MVTDVGPTQAEAVTTALSAGIKFFVEAENVLPDLDPYRRRSLIGYCIFLGAALLSWKTKKQNAVSRSTAEAEYHSIGSTACELT
ncbi:UNVERIFIED_CONTAM: hypothetical protein Scaly_2047800 [Sesamum calycinum]|uniref:Uncharacterized protein n=1 Tax=Sesamum calycinum TaxID=2727403 RepID=A0AAW2N144_9LAMI